jgi:hypothetical protein
VDRGLKKICRETCTAKHGKRTRKLGCQRNRFFNSGVVQW